MEILSYTLSHPETFHQQKNTFSGNPHVKTSSSAQKPVNRFCDLEQVPTKSEANRLFPKTDFDYTQSESHGSRSCIVDRRSMSRLTDSKRFLRSAVMPARGMGSDKIFSILMDIAELE